MPNNTSSSRVEIFELTNSLRQLTNLPPNSVIIRVGWRHAILSSSTKSEPTMNKKESRESAATSPPCTHGCCGPNQCLGAAHESRPKHIITSTMASRENFAQSTKSTIFPNTHFTNHESLPSLPDAFSAFLDAYPHYHDTRDADRIRDTEYPHLDRHVCLDYTGLSLFSHAQLHSSSSSSSSSSRLQPAPFFSISYKPTSLASHVQYNDDDAAAGNNSIESAMRRRIMRFLNVSEDCYSMVCTANKTTAFGLLAETYPFRTNKRLLTVYEHESEAADAMAECARRRGAKVASAGFSWPGLRIDSAKLKKALTKKKKDRGGGLLVFPLQSSMTGTRHPYFWMRLAQENGWHVLLDACALGPKDTDTLGLSLIQPDFMVCSFFNLVGEDPSGFATLFIKKSSCAVLETATSAGIVSIEPARGGASSTQADVDFECEIESDSKLEQFKRFEQGETSDQRSKSVEEGDNDGSDIGIGVEVVACGGLEHADTLGLILISCRLRCLTNWLVTALTKLQHPGGSGHSLVRIYGPRVKFDRGPAVAFNVFDWRGEKVEPALVQKLADRSSISLGCGFLRNICFPDDVILERKKKKKCRASTGGSAGISVVNASLGFMSNFEDAYRLWSFVAHFLDADFVEKERWRYMALNRKMVEM